MDITIYNFADDLQANVKGAELVSVEVSSDACSALIVVKGEIAKNQPTLRRHQDLWFLIPVLKVLQTWDFQAISACLETL